MKYGANERLNGSVGWGVYRGVDVRVFKSVEVEVNMF